MKQVGQVEHYDHILDGYKKHYFDPKLLAYRERYIYRRMFDGVDLSGKRVIELACGSGFNTNAVRCRFPVASVTGLDISPRLCQTYEANTGCPALVFNLTRAEQPEWPEPADHAFVMAGLHHCIRDLSATFANIRRLLKPGGTLLMVEPNADFMLSGLRIAWYKADRWFQAQDDAPLSHDQLAQVASPGFVPQRVAYLGGAAYFLILNSLIMRFPPLLKRVMAPSLFVADDIYNLLPRKAPFPMFIAQWTRTSAS